MIESLANMDCCVTYLMIEGLLSIIDHVIE